MTRKSVTLSGGEMCTSKGEWIFSNISQDFFVWCSIVNSGGNTEKVITRLEVNSV